MENTSLDCVPAEQAGNFAGQFTCGALCPVVVYTVEVEEGQVQPGRHRGIAGQDCPCGAPFGGCIHGFPLCCSRPGARSRPSLLGWEDGPLHSDVSCSVNPAMLHSQWSTPLGDRLSDACQTFGSCPDRPAEKGPCNQKAVGVDDGWGVPEGAASTAGLLGCCRLCCRSIPKAVRGCAVIVRWRPGGAGYSLRKIWSHALKQDQQGYAAPKDGATPTVPAGESFRRVRCA